MARAVAKKQNGRWIVLVDVDNYGGDELSVREANAFAYDVKNACRDARDNNARDALG